MDKSEGIIIYPHSLLMKEYLKIAQQEGRLLDFYFRSLQIFDEVFSKSEQGFGRFINGANKYLAGRYAYIILELKNSLDSFFAHYLILKNGLCDSSILHLRYFHESLTKNYFYLTRPIREKDMEKYNSWNFTDIRKRIYTEHTIETRFKPLYHALSTKSHAGIHSSSPTFECSPNSYKDSLETGIFFLHSYFVFLLECFNQFISQEDRIKIRNFFGEFSNAFPNEIPAFIPDKEDIIPFLKFQNIKMVNPIDVEKLKRNKQEYLDNS